MTHARVSIETYAQERECEVCGTELLVGDSMYVAADGTETCSKHCAATLRIAARDERFMRALLAEAGAE